MRACGVMANGIHIDFSGTIFLHRFMVAIKFLDSKLTEDQIWFLANNSGCGQTEVEGEDKSQLISFQAFLRGLRKSLGEVQELFAMRSQYLNEEENKEVFNDLESECSDEIDEKEVELQRLEDEKLRAENIAKHCTFYEEFEIDSFQDVEDGLEEVTVSEEDLPQDDEDDQEQVDEEADEEDRLVGSMDLPTGWNDGEFEVSITHCDRCHLHYHYSRHSEDEHINKFNEIGDGISGTFPSVKLVGNFEEPHRLDCFEVYVNCLGFKSRRDNRGKFYLFKKTHKGRFPTVEEITDQLICLSMIYGDSKKMGSDQAISQSKRSTGGKYKLCHEHPADTPDDVKKQPVKASHGL